MAQQITHNVEVRPNRFMASFGPGLLWAATAIGVSHLVQSTRAGALAGLGLAGTILLALLLKYPFFEYGGRYAAATGESLIEGYRRIGAWAVWIFAALTAITGLVATSAVVLFTSFLLRYAFGLDLAAPAMAGVLMTACAAILVVGRYRALDTTVKILVGVLAASTVLAAGMVASRVDPQTLRLWPIPRNNVPPVFLLALVGWMPAPLELAAWSSLWTLAKRRATGNSGSVAGSRLDFTIGYAGTSLLAFAFLILGAGVMYGSPEGFSPRGPIFVTQLVELYTQALGAWTRPIVLLVSLSTMVSTVLTVMDGIPRVIERCVQNLRGSPPAVSSSKPNGPIYWICLALLVVLTLFILTGFAGTLTALVDFATVLSFLTAPIVGWLTLRVVRSSEMPAQHRPGPAMVALSWLGLGLIGGAALLWIGTRLVG